MFGIDLGITISSVSCITTKNKVIDYRILFGDKKNKDHWSRCTRMADEITYMVREISSQGKYTIDTLVSIEEPVFPYRTRNPQSYFNMCCLYALVRARLTKWNYTVYSIHPMTAKSIAKKVFGVNVKGFSSKFIKRGSLTKRGMIRAYFKLKGKLPNYHTIVGRETLADSFFIAKAGIEKRRIEIEVQG